MQNKIHDAPKLSRRKQNKKAQADISSFLEKMRQDVLYRIRGNKIARAANDENLKLLKAELAEVSRLIDLTRNNSKK